MISVDLRVSELGLDFNRPQSNGIYTVCGRNSAVVANLPSTGLDIDPGGMLRISRRFYYIAPSGENGLV